MHGGVRGVYRLRYWLAVALAQELPNRRCVLEGKLHNSRPSTASWCVVVLEMLAPCVKWVTSERGVVLEVVRDQLLNIVLCRGVRL